MQRQSGCVLTSYGALIFDAQLKAFDFVIIPQLQAASAWRGFKSLLFPVDPIALTRTSDTKRRLHEAGAAHFIAPQVQVWSPK